MMSFRQVVNVLAATTFAVGMMTSASATTFSAKPTVVSTTYYWNQIIGFDNAGNELGRIDDKGCSGGGITIASDGTIYGINVGAGQVHKWGATGDYIGMLQTGMYYPVGITTAPNGNLYAVSNGATNGIYVIHANDPLGSNVDRWSSDRENEPALWDITAANGHLWATSNSANQVREYGFNENGTGSLLNTYSVVNPNGITADNNGNVYVVSAGSSIMKLASGGSNFQTLATGFAALTDVVYDGRGSILFSDYSPYTGAGRVGIWQYDLSKNVLSGFGGTGLPVAYLGAAPTAVPEPSSLVALISGTLGFMISRRKKA